MAQQKEKHSSSGSRFGRPRMTEVDQREENNTSLDLVEEYQDRAESTTTRTAKGQQQDHDVAMLKSFLMNHPDIRQNPDSFWNSTSAAAHSSILENNNNNDTSTPIMDTTLSMKNHCSTERTHNRHSVPKWNYVLVVLRSTLVDLPLTLIFAVFVAMYCFRSIHHDYFVPFFSAALVDNDRLLDEFTYYERSCGSQDLSTTNLQDIVLETSKTTPHQAADTMLKHGAMVFPKVLEPSTLQTLRDFVVRRNGEIYQRGEAYPVSQGFNRASFGIDATEDPIVAKALGEIASHPLLGPSLEQLLGVDPAVTEITAITAYHGCSDQAWHPDVKPDGNGVKFARTFMHSYSLFIPLQDTSAAMGATELCPGTHMCADEDLYELCDYHGIQLNEASHDGIWHGGDAALLSQQVWHRGYGHNAQGEQERVVFIVSFISRPQLGTDHRQLARGTYFHLKWNMWGHTFQDLWDSFQHMDKPYSYLRCLGLWKAPGRNWGYDLITSSVMRIVNNQGGMDYSDLPRFVDNVIHNKFFSLPYFLEGTIMEMDGAWQRYIQETIDNCFYFLGGVNAVLMVYYLYLVYLVHHSGVFGKRSVLPRAMLRIIVTHGVVVALGYLILQHVSHSQWGSNIASGKTLMKPFAPYDVQGHNQNVTAKGITTLPERDDILVGSRFDAKYIGAFNRWLNFHPGNVEFDKTIEPHADAIASYKNSNDNAATYNQLESFVERYLESVVKEFTSRGQRFLRQNYHNGDWEIMSTAEATEYAEFAILTKSNGLLATLDREISFLLADYRFGHYRGTQLALDSQSYLLKWRNIVFGKPTSALSTFKKMELMLKNKSSKTTHHRINVFARSPSLLRKPNLVSWKLPLDHTRTRFMFPVGSIVLSHSDEDNKWFKARVTRVVASKGNRRSPPSFGIRYDDNGMEAHQQLAKVVKFSPLSAGGKVTVKVNDSGWIPGTITRVMPSGEIDALLKNGDVRYRVPRHVYHYGFGEFNRS